MTVLSDPTDRSFSRNNWGFETTSGPWSHLDCSFLKPVLSCWLAWRQQTAKQWLGVLLLTLFKLHSCTPRTSACPLFPKQEVLAKTVAKSSVVECTQAMHVSLEMFFIPSVFTHHHNGDLYTKMNLNSFLYFVQGNSLDMNLKIVCLCVRKEVGVFSPNTKKQTVEKQSSISNVCGERSLNRWENFKSSFRSLTIKWKKYNLCKWKQLLLGKMRYVCGMHIVL